MPNTFPVDRLHEILDVDLEKGLLKWKARSARHFEAGKKNTAEAIASMWNARHAGKEAGSLDRKGYTRLTIGNKRYLAHRIIWAMVNGSWPDEEIDHINGLRNDNRIENLASVTKQENQKNRKAQSGTSKWPGVSWHKTSQRWQARIWVDGKRRFLGTYENEQEAAKAYRAAAELAGFTYRHMQPFTGEPR